MSMRLLIAALLCQDPAYDSKMLAVGPSVDQILVRDVDGDGRDDLLVQSGKDLRFFRNDPDKGIPEQATQTLRFDANVYLWSPARIRNKSSWAVVTQSPRGIHEIPFADGAFAPRSQDLVIHPTLFEGESGEARPPARVEFAPDLDGDGLSDLLLFREEEIFVLVQRQPGTFRLAQKLPLPDDAKMTIAWSPTMANKEERTIPMLTFGDANGDGRPDITFYREESIAVYAQKEEGRFVAGSSQDLAKEKDKNRARFVKFELPPIIADFNRDGVQDLALPYPREGRVHIFYLSGSRSNWTDPDDVIQVGDSWTVGVYAEDLDGDRKPDLVVGIIRKFGIFGGIQAFVSGKVKLELHVHRMRSRFDKDPDQVLTFEVPFSFNVTRTEATVDLAFRPTMEADVNGDGARDLLLSDDAETIRIYYGSKERGFHQEAGGKIVLGAPQGVSYTHVTAADFNKDGRSDLVLKHIHIDQQRHFLQLKMSRR